MNNSAKKASILHIFIFDRIILIKLTYPVVYRMRLKLSLHFRWAGLDQHPLIFEFNSWYSQKTIKLQKVH